MVHVPKMTTNAGVQAEVQQYSFGVGSSNLGVTYGVYRGLREDRLKPAHCTGQPAYGLWIDYSPVKYCISA